MDLSPLFEIFGITHYVPHIVAVASLFCALTPTPKKNTFYGRLYSVIEVLAINVGKAKK